MKIIYIDKSESEQEFFSRSFGRHQVKCFNDAFSAYQHMRDSNEPDILVTEIRSVDDPAIEVLRHIRNKQAFKKTIIIGYSELHLPDREKIHNDGFLDVVSKNKLVSTVLQIIHLFTSRHGKSGLVTLYSRRSMIVKRAIDITVSSVALLLASPVLIAAAIAIRIESKGTVFYRSRRVGSNYKVFDLLKFRTMIPDADTKLGTIAHLNLYGGRESEAGLRECPDCKKAGHPCSPLIYDDKGKICENYFYALQEMEKRGIFFKAKDDPRISRVGKFLRNSSIDELPQLINILRGDMSLVGNRPLPLYEAEKLTSDSRAFRFLAPAGLTGLWQVTKRGKKDMSEEERISLDNNYALNHSIWLDFKIIFKTFPALLQSENV
jgi:lipopolysaccharide/colanic/teichoic acid biosynthesis glycosyltransferase